MHILESFHAWGVWQGAEPRVVVWNESFFLSLSLSLCLSESAFVFLSRFFLQELISVSVPGEMIEIGSLGGQRSCVLCEPRDWGSEWRVSGQSSAQYSSTALMASLTHTERQPAERGSSFSPSFTHTVYSLIHALRPSISILFTYSFIYFIDTFICLLTLN